MKTIYKLLRLIIQATLIILSFINITELKAKDHNLGVGIYPGNAKENFAPSLIIDSINYRNIALRRPAYHSSCFDFNLTAQLITDGIKDTTLPVWFSVSTSTDSFLNKNKRQVLFDKHLMTSLDFKNPNFWIELECHGKDILPVADSIVLIGSIFIGDSAAKKLHFKLSASEDRKTWKTLIQHTSNDSFGNLIQGPWRKYVAKNLRVFRLPFAINEKSIHQFYKFEIAATNVLNWRLTDISFIENKKDVHIGGPYNFTSAWIGAGKKDEWVYVDLGAKCTFDKIKLCWIRRALKGVIQVSDNANNWVDISNLPEGKGYTDIISFKQQVKGQYVRVLMKQPATSDGYILSELEVFGKGSPIAKPHKIAENNEISKIDLSGGAWKLQRSSQVNETGETLSKPGFIDNDWLVATVPGTILASFKNVGAVPYPYYSNNQEMISDSYFYSDFWYRNEFNVPSNFKEKETFLNFDGINWKAQVYLNGNNLGRIEGAFIRGKFDITKILVPGQKNYLAVKIEKNETPGYPTEQTLNSTDANGGELGADNPTFHASVGWDWIPTIRGRNTGIWNDVFISSYGPVTIEDSYVSTDIPLPDTSVADIKIDVLLKNNSLKDINGKLAGKFGDIKFEQIVSLKGKESIHIIFSPSTNSVLHLINPKLWWPNGYGEQNFYPVDLSFITSENKLSDEKKFKTGVKKYTYSETDNKLKIWINGKRFIGFGGNWGFPEAMLLYRKREYDIAVRYHKDMHFTMIRNWVGQTADEEFYDACDKYGIVVWQDFWLANPVDGPDPKNSDLFIKNADDFIKKIRNHPSVGLYCGRNEGNPPIVIDTALRNLINTNHEGIHYISNSAFGGVSGGGPYRAMPEKFYFQERATERLHSELGMPNMVSYESLKQMIPDSLLWPQGNLWGIHDFCLEGAQRGSSFNKMMEDRFGRIDNVKDWLSLAQWINYDGYRAMFEAQSKNRMGLLLWMSHPAWPSMVWQTYDYYFEPTAAYFGAKKATEPLHIQWNAFTDSIEVVNYCSQIGNGIRAYYEIINQDGKTLFEKDTIINSLVDSRVKCFKPNLPPYISDLYFLRLKLIKEKDIISENFYVRGKEDISFKHILEIPKLKLEKATKIEKRGNTWYMVSTIVNNTNFPALMIKLKIVGEKSRERILPAIFSDNYISLMPGEKRNINIEFEDADTQGQNPVLEVEGYNILKE